MNDEEREKKDRMQEDIHTALEELLDLADGDVLVGWVICYEGMGTDNLRRAGHMYGPSTQTDWGALGLIEWVRRVSMLLPEDDTDEGDD